MVRFCHSRVGGIERERGSYCSFAGSRGREAGVCAFHKADAVFFPVVVAWLWVGLLMGFVPEMIEPVTKQESPYLWIVHGHAAIFVAWMTLLTVQLSLVRTRRIDVHRRLGPIGAAWAPLMVGVGVVTAVMVDRSHFGTEHWRPQFAAIQFGDLLNFAILAAAALTLRRDGASHKRLMLLATVALCNAGFARWWGPYVRDWLGVGYLPRLLGLYVGDFLIIAAMLAYDVVTRGRPNRALLYGWVADGGRRVPDRVPVLQPGLDCVHRSSAASVTGAAYRQVPFRLVRRRRPRGAPLLASPLRQAGRRPLIALRATRRVTDAPGAKRPAAPCPRQRRLVR